MKQIFIIFVMFIFCPVYAAQIVNVEYIHNAIKQKYDITVPYSSDLTNPRVAANMKYLLTAVDVANEILNGSKTTDYGGGEYATVVAADTVATDTAVETLISVPDTNDYKFFATVDIPRTMYELSFDALAEGDFFINWGDGSPTEYVTNPDYGIKHTYASPGKYDIKFGGLATGGSPSRFPEYRFSIVCDSLGADCVSKISGCLGCIFPTLPDGTNPRFGQLLENSSITVIPDGLFAGLHGGFADNMFYRAFANTKITSIPENLFADLQSTESLVRGNVFDFTFYGTPITTIPENLFAGVRVASGRMFGSTFSGTQIKEIPAGLFSFVRNAVGYGSFCGTFADTPITSIPEDLFAGMKVTASYTFGTTFAGTNITGIPENLFADITWIDEYPDSTFDSTFANTKITSIPEHLFDSFFQNDFYSANYVFLSTFANCEHLERLPNNLFAGLRWEGLEEMGAYYIFATTFENCTSLTEIPDNLFGTNIMPKFEDYSYMYSGAFSGTFIGCNALTGASARTNGQYFYEKWPDADEDIFYAMYYGATGLSDYDDIPDVWKSF